MAELLRAFWRMGWWLFRRHYTTDPKEHDLEALAWSCMMAILACIDIDVRTGMSPEKIAVIIQVSSIPDCVLCLKSRVASDHVFRPSFGTSANRGWQAWCVLMKQKQKQKLCHSTTRLDQKLSPR